MNPHAHHLWQSSSLLCHRDTCLDRRHPSKGLLGSVFRPRGRTVEERGDEDTHTIWCLLLFLLAYVSMEDAVIFLRRFLNKGAVDVLMITPPPGPSCPQPLQRPYFASPFPAALTINLLNPFVLCVQVCMGVHLANPPKSQYTKKWFQRKAGGSATCCKNITPEMEFNFIPAVILLLFDYPHASGFFFSSSTLQLFIFISRPQMFAFVACCHPARCQFNFKNCCFVSFRMTNFIAWDCRKQGLQEHIWPDHPTADWI